MRTVTFKIDISKGYMYSADTTSDQSGKYVRLNDAKSLQSALINLLDRADITRDGNLFFCRWCGHQMKLGDAYCKIHSCEGFKARELLQSLAK